MIRHIREINFVRKDQICGKKTHGFWVLYRTTLQRYHGEQNWPQKLNRSYRIAKFSILWLHLTFYSNTQITCSMHQFSMNRQRTRQFEASTQVGSMFLKPASLLSVLFWKWLSIRVVNFQHFLAIIVLQFMFANERLVNTFYRYPTEGIIKFKTAYTFFKEYLNKNG